MCVCVCPGGVAILKMEWMEIKEEDEKRPKQRQRRTTTGWTLMPQHEEISLLLSLSRFHWMDDPANPSCVAEKIITTGSYLSPTPLTSTQWLSAA